MSKPSSMVYLAGGLRSGWQDGPTEAIKRAGGRVFDPRNLPQDISDPSALLPIELQMIADANSLLAYVEPDYCPVGLCAEVGYAYAVGTPVVLCFAPEVPMRSSWKWLCGFAETVWHDLPLATIRAFDVTLGL